LFLETKTEMWNGQLVADCPTDLSHALSKNFFCRTPLVHRGLIVYMHVHEYSCGKTVLKKIIKIYMRLLNLTIGDHESRRCVARRVASDTTIASVGWICVINPYSIQLMRWRRRQYSTSACLRCRRSRGRQMRAHRDDPIRRRPGRHGIPWQSRVAR